MREKYIGVQNTWTLYEIFHSSNENLTTKFYKRTQNICVSISFILFFIHGYSKKNEFEYWVWVLSFNSKLRLETHQKWVTQLKLRLKTHWKWVTQLKTQTQNSLKMRLKLNTQTHFFLSSHVCFFLSFRFIFFISLVWLG
jgi:hypothetical protein